MSKVTPQKSEMKILMIHGYTQSGPLFRAKLRALEKNVQKLLNPHAVSLKFLYPTAPIPLRPRDIPNFKASEGVQGEGDPDSQDSDMWAWFRLDEATKGYHKLDEGMRVLTETIKEAGGVDGVLGFSQGACVASLVTAALEANRKVYHSGAADATDREETVPDWVSNLREANGNAPLQFALYYSGFRATPTELVWCYQPALQTPSMHFIGTLDTVVDESRMQSLVDACSEPARFVIRHPGGHFVPITKDYAKQVAGFLINSRPKTPEELEAEKRRNALDDDDSM